MVRSKPKKFFKNAITLLQHIWYTKKFELRNEYKCLDYDGKKVVAYSCHGLQGNQMFVYDENVGDF